MISSDGRRIAGTDQGPGKIVYQVGLTTYSDSKLFREGWERTFGEKKDGRLDTGSDKTETPVSDGDRES